MFNEELQKIPPENINAVLELKKMTLPCEIPYYLGIFGSYLEPKLCNSIYWKYNLTT